jgi:hypothetical protein
MKDLLVGRRLASMNASAMMNATYAQEQISSHKPVRLLVRVAPYFRTLEQELRFVNCTQFFATAPTLNLIKNQTVFRFCGTTTKNGI